MFQEAVKNVGTRKHQILDSETRKTSNKKATLQPYKLLK